MRKSLVFLAFVASSFVFSSSATASNYPNGVEQIRNFDVNVVIEPSGVLEVTESINYDFGFLTRHGIFRDIPTVYVYNEKNDRLIKITKFSAAVDGVSTEVKKSSTSVGPNYRIGDPNNTISGNHLYTIKYKVAGVINSFSDHLELNWNVNGNGWDVPVDKISATVSSPTSINEVNCFQGGTYSRLGCLSAGYGSKTATFSSQDLGPRQGMTIVVSLPKSGVAAPQYFREKFSFASAFRATPKSIAGAIIIALLSFFFTIYLWLKKGRDEEFSGSPIDAAMGTSGPSQPTSVMGSAATPVQFAPPDNLRPAQIAGVMFQEVRSRDMSATIVDLAARGYLTITEAQSGSVFKHQDWIFKRTEKPSTDLEDFELSIYTGIFGADSEKKLSELKGTFAPDLRNAISEVNKDLLKRNYYRHKPGSVRAAYVGIGVLLLVISIVIVVFVARGTHAGLAVLPLPFAAIAFILNAHNMPARTAKGTAAYRLSVGFRRLFTDQEAQRAKFQEDHSIFEKYLPYAVTFGVANIWAKNFSALAAESGVPAVLPLWYIGGTGANFDHFAESIDHFAVVSAGSMGYTPASTGSSGFSGGGFSGGGMGGGGGGSW